jgi:hypothetical protein
VSTPGELVPTRAIEPMVLLSPAILSDDEIGRIWRIAKSLAASGMFKDVTQAEQAFGRILIGRDLGLSAAQSLMGLDVVRGNLQLRGTLLGRLVRQSAEYDYAPLQRSKAKGEEFAIVAIYRRGEDGKFPRADDEVVINIGDGTTVLIKEGERIPEGVEKFTIQDAQQMKLVKPDSAWQTIPAVMVVWRALAQAVRFHAPDLLGGIPVYTEADSLEEIPQLASGEGDGSEPGWIGVSAPQVKALEAMIESALAKGHAGLSDRATLQMRIAGQTPAFIDEQLAAWGKELAEFEPVPEADVVEPVDAEPEPEPPADDGQGRLA